MANHRFVINTLPKLQEASYNLALDYEHLPLLTLEAAVENISHLVPDVASYVSTAKKKCNRDSTLLTWNESAAIFLYTMPVPFYFRLNNTLRAENRQALRPWLAFLKLFTTALEKLPPTKATIWRGVNYDARLNFVENDVYTWWSITTCSTNINSITNYLGGSGTLFAIETVHGRDVSMFSSCPYEEEIILMPGTCVRTKSQSLNFVDRLFVIHLEEINPQSESNRLFEQIKQEYQRNNRIERSMNPAISFPIEQSYINLSIVDTKEQRKKEKKLCDTQYTTAIMDTFEEIYGMKTTIDVEDIFRACKDHEKQVLVFGRAGIGKSTFCRYIAYQWAIGSYWPQYELLALIPLRQLTVRRYPSNKNYSLIDLIRTELFPLDLNEKEEEQLKKQFDSKKTLWILDGYEEIVQNIPPHLQPLLEQLLKTPHHIITSRPYLNTLSYNVQMEIIGFTDENIKNYIQSFFRQINDELDDTQIKSDKLMNFLRSNPSIWGVAHIPVNLELICSLWSNATWSETKQLTMTRLYTMMTESLCRRYLTAQGIAIQKLSTSQMYQRCQKEMAFLESLAFHAMESNTILIRPLLLEEASDETKISSEDYSHILNIGILQSVNKHGINTQIETNKDHYFIHLSFQEYFAARYLINALKGSQAGRSIAFIRHHKYDQRYTLLLSFAAGFVSEKDAKSCSDLFWDTLLGPPVDLVGSRHMQLVIACMEETNGTQTHPRRFQLLEWVAQCIKFSFTMESKVIRQHLTQSLQRAQSVTCDPTVINELIHLLEHHDVKRQAEVLLCISELQISNPSIELIRSVTTRLDDRDEQVRINACQALGKMGEKAATGEVISKLVSALRDDSDDVRANVSEALGKIGEKAGTNEVISRLVSALEDQSERVRKNACEALGKMGEKAVTNEVISKLVYALQDESEYVRGNACEALGQMGEKAVTNEVINGLVSALQDESDYVRGNACKALGKMGEKAATNEVIVKLVTALEDESGSVRGNASEALEKICGKVATNEVISELMRAISDKSEYIRRNVCKALGKMGEKAVTNEVINKLVGALRDENEYVRGDACEALGQMGEKAVTDEVIGELVRAISDGSEYIRRNVCKALGKMGEKAVTNEVISKLVGALQDKNEYVRGDACEALGQMGEKAVTNEVISRLVSALQDESDYVRGNTCEAFGKMGKKAATNEVIVKLVSALEDENEVVRQNACRALGDMGEKVVSNELIGKLVSALRDENEYVREDASEALASPGEKAVTSEVISELVSALQDESEYVRGNACKVLGNMANEAITNEVVGKLVILINGDSEYARRNAANAVGNLVAAFDIITQLDPKIILDICLSQYGSDILKSASVEQLMMVFFTTQNPGWVAVVTHFSLLKGAAVTASEDKVVVYDAEEPSELLIPNFQLRRQLIDAFIVQTKRLGLFFAEPFSDIVKPKGENLEDIGKLRPNEDDQTTGNTQSSTNLTSQTRITNPDENQNVIVLCLGIGISDQDLIPKAVIDPPFQDEFKFIARSLSIKDKTIFVIISAVMGDYVVPLIHRHYCIEKIYLYGETGGDDLSHQWSSISEKISGPYSDLKQLYGQIANDIGGIREESLCSDRSFDLFTMLHTQQLENESSLMQATTDVTCDERIVIFHCDDQTFSYGAQETSPVNEFSDVRTCVQFIDGHSQSQLFLVVSGNPIPSEIKSIFDAPQICAIYLFRTNELEYSTQKRKVSGLFHKQEELFKKVYMEILFFRQPNIHTIRIKTCSSFDREKELISQLNPEQMSFLALQFYIDILPGIPPLHTSNEQENVFEQSPEFWDMISRLRQIIKVEDLFPLQNRLIDIQKRVLESPKILKPVTVYLAKIASYDTLDTLQSSNARYFNIGMYLIATKSLLTARHIARQAANNSLVSILFEIEIAKGTRLQTINTDHVLLPLGSVFRLMSSNLAPDNVWYIKIKDVHEEFQLIKQQLQLEIGTRLSWLTYGIYLSFLHCVQQGEAYFKLLLDKLSLEPIDRLSINSNMALMYTMNNQEAKANYFYDLVLDSITAMDSDTVINKREDLYNMTIPTTNMIIPKNLVNHSTVLGNIGDVYYKRNNRTKALEFYKKAFESTTDQHCSRYYQQKIQTLSKT